MLRRVCTRQGAMVLMVLTVAATTSAATIQVLLLMRMMILVTASILSIRLQELERTQQLESVLLGCWRFLNVLFDNMIHVLQNLIIDSLQDSNFQDRICCVELVLGLLVSVLVLLTIE